MGVEQETRDFFIKIVNSIAIVLLWMIANVFFGIYMGFGFFEGSPSLKNIIYYLIFLITLYLLLRYLVKKWKF
ncbi:MAG: hypothetical protein WAT19_11680 [Ferruginibacter sp.]